MDHIRRSRSQLLRVDRFVWSVFSLVCQILCMAVYSCCMGIARERGRYNLLVGCVKWYAFVTFAIATCHPNAYNMNGYHAHVAWQCPTIANMLSNHFPHAGLFLERADIMYFFAMHVTYSTIMDAPRSDHETTNQSKRALKSDIIEHIGSSIPTVIF